MTEAWSGDWEKRLTERLKTVGFENVTALLESRPGVPYEAIADFLGKHDIAAVQVSHLHAAEATTENLESASRDSLARFLNASLPKRGWGIGPYWRAGVAGAVAPWRTTWQSRIDSIMNVADVTKKLLTLNPPDGWRPASANDPFLLMLFESMRRKG